MSDIEITLKLPEALVKRAAAVGLAVETVFSPDLLEQEIARREAGQYLLDVAEKLQALPAELKPTEEEIKAAIQDFWAEKANS